MTDTGIKKVKILTHLKIQNVLCVAVTTLLGLIPSVVLSENNIVPVVGKNLMFDQTEVTIGAFENFVRATGTVTQAERDGLVPLTFRSPNSFMQSFIQRPRGFFHPVTSVVVLDYRTR